MGMTLTPEKKVGIFRMLASKALYDVGLEFGFDKYYKDAKAIKGAVYRAYTDVRNNPDKYGITKEAYDLVVDAVGARKIAHRKDTPTLRERMDEEVDIKDLVLSNRDKVAKLMAQKLDMVSKKELKKMRLSEFVNLFGVLFDKGQIIQGQATEHIAHLSKVEDGLSPKELLDTVLKQREHEIEKKNK